MDLNLRQAIFMNVKGQSAEQLREVIDESVGHEEKTLPGLGVLFEVIWQYSSETDKQQMVNTLHANL